MKLNAILAWGITDKTSDFINRKIRLTNILALVLLGLLAFYGIIAALLAPPLLPYLGVGAFVYASILLLNKWRLQAVARFLMSIAPMYVVAMLHALILSVDDSMMVSIYVFQACTMILPWVLIDYENWLPFTFATLIALIPLFAFPSFNAFFEIEVQSEVFQQAWLNHTILLGGLGLTLAVVFFLQMMQKKAELKTLRLVEEIDLQNKERQQKEADLQKTVSELERSREEEKKRTWATEGLAQISTLLRGDDNLQDLSDKIIAYVVKYLGANQGGLFVINDDDESDKYIELKAAYAYSRKKYMEKRIAFGQGLVGQCYLEKEYILLSEIPREYIAITSGLGDATPSFLLITPMIVNEEVYGIFEVAAFRKFEKHEIDFMMQLGENIALTLNSIKINDKTKVLLQETQMQAEQMRAQEEEMRQNMEELQATQENQQRLQEEMKENEELLKEREKELLKKIEKLEGELTKYRNG
ncbi:GAF domain-containing protein [Cytophagales bacterium LB-30]|uniref:GAF domain-containing protein n=1 Tax=Shiella aurantiaca TaxID=3058365 RepID=A0ABT8F607_9BACT|nr:GAF domain-containing protein [Shiella aurantiaca]MDN4165880.1 GAF domain-containing protein [Shiella aurantiaca]